MKPAPTELLQLELGNASFSVIFAPCLNQDCLARMQQSVDLAVVQRLTSKRFQVSQWAEPKLLDAALQTPAVPATEVQAQC